MIHKRIPWKIHIAALALLLFGAVAVRTARAFFTIDGVVSISFTANDRRTVGINTSANLPVNAQPGFTYTNGAGAGQAATLYQGSLTLTSGAASIDLNGVLTDSYGSTVSLVRVKAIFIQNNSASNTMTFGAAGSNPWIGLLNSTGTITLQPGDCFCAVSGSATGYVVVASTGDLLKVAGTGTDGFTLVILGSPT